MCLQCIQEPFIKRLDSAMDDGCFIVNFEKCSQCGERQMPITQNRQEVTTVEEEDNTDPPIPSAEIEEINFNHVCGNPSCSHVIAPHFFRETITTSAKEAMMECPLCGKGSRVFMFDEDEAGPPLPESEERMKDILAELKAAERVEKEEDKQKREALFQNLKESMPVMAEDEVTDESDWDDV